MIMRYNKLFEQNSLFPNTDWYNEGNLVIDETTEQGKILVQKIIENYPYYDLVIVNGQVVDVAILPKPEPEPIEAEPTVEDYLLDYEFRISMLELGL